MLREKMHVSIKRGEGAKSIYKQSHQSPNSDDGEWTHLLEIKGDECYDADDKALPVNEVFGCSQREGCRTDKSQRRGFQCRHDALEQEVLLPLLIHLGNHQHDEERRQYNGKRSRQRAQDTHRFRCARIGKHLIPYVCGRVDADRAGRHLRYGYNIRKRRVGNPPMYRHHSF